MCEAVRTFGDGCAAEGCGIHPPVGWCSGGVSVGRGVNSGGERQC